MKNFKRISSVVLAIVMVFAMMVPAMAADGKITISGANENEDYVAYKIFDVKYVPSATPADKDDPHSYTIAASSPFVAALTDYPTVDGAWFTFTPSASDASVLVVTKNATYTDAADLAAYLQTYVATNAIDAAYKTTKTADSTGIVEFTGLDEGYYFVDTTVGTLCIIDTTNSYVEIEDKNEDPKIEKTVEEAGVYGETSYAEVGDTVNFKIVVTAQKGAEDYVVHDELSEGLTLDTNSFAVKVDGADLETSNYTIKTADFADDCDFEISFTKAYLDTITEETEITITYSAELNEAAIKTDANTNSAKLTYGDKSSVTDTTTTDSFELDLTKTDGTTLLTGAEFNLYDAKEDGNQIKLVALTEEEVTAAGDTYDADTNYYRVANAAEKADATESDVIEAGKVKIYGLDGNKAYYLEETVAPIGYNILTERVALEDAASAADKELEVVNETGVELPETGGIGTTIFYLVGGLMVTGAFVLLITKKRMGNRA